MTMMYYLILLVCYFIPGNFPPPHEHPEICHVHKMVKDEDGKLKTLELDYGQLLKYTPPEMVPYMHDMPLIEADVQLIKEGKTYSFMLQMTVHTTQADKYFGGISDQNKMRLVLLDGSSVYPEIAQVFESPNPATEGKRVYRALFSLTKREVKELKKWGVDEMGLFWKQGYESYDIRDVDFFKQRLLCIDKIVEYVRS